MNALCPNLRAVWKGVLWIEQTIRDWKTFPAWGKKNVGEEFITLSCLTLSYKSSMGKILNYFPLLSMARLEIVIKCIKSFWGLSNFSEILQLQISI